MPKNSNFGFYNIDKPLDLTSHDVVNYIRRLTSLRRVGHTGTLDPFATGVLLVVVGPATRLIQYTHTLPKEYQATLTLGATSDTDDRTGSITPLTGATIPTTRQVNQALEKFTGSITQTPPTYSAIKVHGTPLYQHARAGRTAAAQAAAGERARTITIHALELLNYQYPLLTLRIICSTGTYVRSLARDLGQTLNSGAYVQELQRTKIGNFTIKNAVKLETLTSENRIQHLQLPEALVDHLPRTTLSIDNVAQFRQGRAVPWNNNVPLTQPLAIFSSNHQLVGIGEGNPVTSLLEPRTVLPSP